MREEKGDQALIIILERLFPINMIIKGCKVNEVATDKRFTTAAR